MASSIGWPQLKVECSQPQAEADGCHSSWMSWSLGCNANYNDAPRDAVD
jgi:hypothetical protein